jgi:chromosome segregation ATPase
VNQTRASVSAAKTAADRALDDARDKVDGLKDDIDDLDDDLDKWGRQLLACKPWEVAKAASLAAKIADGELKMVGLKTARDAARLALDAARAAADAAAAAVTQALAGVNQQLAAANRALDDAKRRLDDIRAQLQRVGDDIRLRSFKAARDAKNAALDQVQHELDLARLRERALLDVGAALATAVPASAFEVTAAGFSGFLDALHGGQVSLALTVRVMRGAPRTITVPFDFTAPAAGFAAIFTQVQRIL